MTIQRTILYFLLLFPLFSLSNSYAIATYKRIPLNVTLNKKDILIVHYDFTSQKGIECHSNRKDMQINFVYKGHQKNALLPVVLEADHIPQKEGIELADLKGQFRIIPLKSQCITKEFAVSCHYLNSE